MKIRVGVSNRHVHLTKEDLEILFGKDYELTVRNYIDQPGQFAANETVTLKTDKNIKENVRIVGPTRKYTQVEILDIDKEYFGLNPPVRNSGDLENSENIWIIGPKGKIYKKSVCIIANRHIHINTRDKKDFYEDQIVSVKINNNIINNVTLLEENDIAMIIKDRYKLLNFNIEKEDFSAKNTNNLIKTLENIIIARNIEKVNLKIQNIKEIIELKQALKI